MFIFYNCNHPIFIIFSLTTFYFISFFRNILQFFCRTFEAGVEPKIVQNENENIRAISRTFSTLSFKDKAESGIMKTRPNTPKFQVMKPSRKLEYRFRRSYQESERKLKEQTRETEKWKKKFSALKEKCVNHCKEIQSMKKENTLLSQKLQYNESVARVLQEYQKNFNRPAEKLKLAQSFSTNSEYQGKRRIRGCHRVVSNFF